MLQQRRIAAEIGEVLRHRSPQSTSIYAKVDMNRCVIWPPRGREAHNEHASGILG